jgi:MFS transporter, AAHS family, 3-hydroxyphenylpropionic acid transporter
MDDLKAGEEHAHLVQGSNSPSPPLVYALCGIAAIVEGFDLQAGGMAAPRFAAEFHMAPDHVGLIFLLTSLGLALGASFGGWLGDRVGSGRAMGVAITLFGLASIGSALAPGETALMIARSAVGLGLGGALPNMIALLTATGPAAMAPRRVTFSIAGLSVGALFVGLIAFLAKEVGWRTMFHLSGWIPLLFGVIVWLLLPHAARPTRHHPARDDRPGEGWRALFDGPHLRVTLLFWLAFFITTALSYVLINWMPTFMTRSGMNQHQVGLGMIGFSLGAATGPMLLAALMRPGRAVRVVCFAFGGIMLGLLLVINAPASPLYLSFAMGFTSLFVAGTQALLYGIVGLFYPDAARGLGVGSSVSVGRIGAGVGPALAGVMLAVGLSQNLVLSGAIPMLVVALGALLVLLRHPPAALQGADG